MFHDLYVYCPFRAVSYEAKYDVNTISDAARLNDCISLVKH